MALIPQDPIEVNINDLMENGYFIQENREYIGYSGIGHPCSRKIWYDFRWVKQNKISRRIKRLFDRGHWEEPRIISDLTNAGFIISNQQLKIIGHEKHIRGHIDGISKHKIFFNNKNLLVEFKTANDRIFKQFVKNGCEKTNQSYYYQVQCYMGKLQSKLEIYKTLFIVTNKNDEKRYIEIIDFDVDAFELMESKAFEILISDKPLEKIGGPSWYECKYCNYYMICHFNDPIQKNCRTCKKGTIEQKGKWSCDGNTLLKLSIQKLGCDNYEILSGLK